MVLGRTADKASQPCPGLALETAPALYIEACEYILGTFISQGVSPMLYNLNSMR
jgi:hypothetical protein